MQPERLANAPPLPEDGAHVWGWFNEMNNERGSDGMNIGRITARTMQDWCWATGNVLDLWERRAIRAIDIVWIAAQRVAK